MKTVEYIGEVLPNGRLSLPDEVKNKLNLRPNCKVKITIAVVTEEKPSPLDEQRAWEVFRNMGKNAKGSGFSDVSTRHDYYLYGKKK